MTHIYHEDRLTTYHLICCHYTSSGSSSSFLRQVMESINNLRKEITIIIIAHRLSTVKNCDKIYILEKGELKNHGTFEELMNIDANFRMNANS